MRPVFSCILLMKPFESGWLLVRRAYTIFFKFLSNWSDWFVSFFLGLFWYFIIIIIIFEQLSSVKVFRVLALAH